MEKEVNNFELNKPGQFTPQNVGENDFLNGKLTDQKYGKWYSVQFQGNAETYLWMTKTPPEIGKSYYGQLELTSSGKSTKFKRLREEESSSKDSSVLGYKARDEDLIVAEWSINAAIAYDPSGAITRIESLAEEFFRMAHKVKASATKPLPPAPGYDKARETAKAIGAKTITSDEDFDPNLFPSEEY